MCYINKRLYLLFFIVNSTQPGTTWKESPREELSASGWLRLCQGGVGLLTEWEDHMDAPLRSLGVNCVRGKKLAGLKQPMRQQVCSRVHLCAGLWTCRDCFQSCRDFPEVMGCELK